jgi:hypothetical protein
VCGLLQVSQALTRLWGARDAMPPEAAVYQDLQELHVQKDSTSPPCLMLTPVTKLNYGVADIIVTNQTLKQFPSLQKEPLDSFTSSEMTSVFYPRNVDFGFHLIYSFHSVSSRYMMHGTRGYI